ncbi:hypothetical protein [Syntrophus aciditrophicus]|nr:hypothetical protein [Syntrophus aciditrophicus]
MNKKGGNGNADFPLFAFSSCSLACPDNLFSFCAVNKNVTKQKIRQLTGNITPTCDHHKRDLLAKVAETRHIALNRHSCLTIIVARVKA